jgi:uncharacterized protein
MTLNIQYDFEWDTQKAVSNLKKHGVSFEQATTIFSDPLALTVFDADHSEYEERWFTLGQDTQDQVLLAVAHTYRDSHSPHIRIRIISARYATKQEQRFYENEPR